MTNEKENMLMTEKELTKEELIEMIDKIFESDDTLSNIQNKVVDMINNFLKYDHNEKG